MSSRESSSRAVTAGGSSDSWRPRTDADLLEAQLRALSEWHRRSATTEVTLGQSREARLDAARRRDAAERERLALYEWAAAPQCTEFRLGAAKLPRAVLAHRHEWLRAKLANELTDLGIDVIATADDGARAAAAVVMEQPDLLFVEELLPTISGLELIRRARVLAPEALVAAQAEADSGMAALQAAGARATFTRRNPPAEIAVQLVRCLLGQSLSGPGRGSAARRQQAVRPRGGR